MVEESRDAERESRNWLIRNYQRFGPRKTNWYSSGGSVSGWMARFNAGLNRPFKSIAIFAGGWMLLEIGWPILILLGVATAGSVWNIPTAIPFMFVVVYGLTLISGSNLVRSLVTQIGNRSDSLVKALFRGYFWSLLSVGLLFTVSTYFHLKMPFMFVIPIVYLLPIEALGNTIPIPVPLGITGWYMDIIFTIIVYTVGVTGSCIGGIEILKHVMDNSHQHGSYGAIFNLLVLAVFPVLNIYFSLVFLTSVFDLFGRFISFVA